MVHVELAIVGDPVTGCKEAEDVPPLPVEVGRLGVAVRICVVWAGTPEKVSELSKSSELAVCRHWYEPYTWPRVATDTEEVCWRTMAALPSGRA
ncbi:hypothetical protein OG474_41445 [Kribbella sp. NBC_01505]|uniref:hypothetical protein n=1 Tax=Kribbella sp. NBC_01505 TaxID=2903580 RepID=UPI00386983C2